VSAPPIDMASCRLCDPPVQMPSALILEHIRAEHDPDFELETWPDGEPVVVVDTTIDPGDFL
jgi:hypothetical protein